MAKSDEQIKEIGFMLLDIGALLMSAGASTARVRNTVNRISETFGYQADMFITHRALMLTVHNEGNSNYFSSVKRISPHGINFKLVSGISRMSWRIVEEKWDIKQIRNDLDRLMTLPHYPRWLVLFMIGISGVSFCRLFGGGIYEMLVTFVSTIIGLIVRQESLKKNFNPYLCVYFAALTASLLSGISIKLAIGSAPELAFTASVLFLIPGVPLINMFSDMMDGNLMNGLIRGLNGLIIAFAIALGLLSTMIVYQI
jgi:uncharacterized membrane protein YjjP (DUF1212 family)